MSLKLAFLFAALASGVGVGLGYYLRVLISLGKKGSVELEIKEKELRAEEKAKKIIADAESKAIETIKEIRLEIKEKEDADGRKKEQCHNDLSRDRRCWRGACCAGASFREHGHPFRILQSINPQ